MADSGASCQGREPSGPLARVEEDPLVFSTMKRLVIYDLDGTLVDTAEDIANAANYMLQVLSNAPLSREDIQRLVGKGLHDLITRCLRTDDPTVIAQGMAQFEAYYGKHLFDHSALYPQAQDILEYFKRRHQAVITNKPQPFARQLLEGLGIAGYFSDIIATGSGFPKKPDPTAVVSLMAAKGVTAQETLIVGDSGIDLETGRNAGVFTVILSHGFADEEELAAGAPDVLVKNFAELLELAKQRGW